MKRVKKLLTVLFILIMLPAELLNDRIQVRADVSALASSYNTDVSYIAYATEVEDQSQTNYCWAYMANAVLESYLMKTGMASNANFSETEMIRQLSSGTYAFSNLYSGGSYRQALAYWTRGSMYGPYLQQYTSPTDYYVSETAELFRYDRSSASDKQNYIQKIKNLIVKYGAVGVSVYFTAQDRSYTTRDGAYYYPQELSPGVNHGVTVVGWDDNFAPQWFYNSMTTPQQPQNKGAFLVKNSWGKYDASSIGGNTGYYWISYDNYFQDAFAVTQVTQRSSLYDRLYETDYRGFYDFTYGSSYSQTYQLSGGAQYLTAISTYVREGASYRIYLNGQELTQTGGTMAQSGYHTFQLANPVSVYGTIELRVDVSGHTESVPMASAADSHQADGNNVCLKAFTRFQSGASNTGNPNTGAVWYPDTSWNTGSSATVSGVTLTPQNCTAEQGASRLFTARVLGNQNPSQRINWQISGSSSSYTRIAENGTLYVGADEMSDVLYVYAISYADPGHSASARVEVVKSSTSGSTGTSTGTAGTGTNINGSVNTGVTGTGVNTGTAGTDNTGTNINGSANTSGAPPVAEADTDADEGAIETGIVDKGLYTVWEAGIVQYTKCTEKSRTSISIPANVKLGGKEYEVSVLAKGAFRNHTKVKTITVGINVSQIEENVFAGCSQLKKIKIKSEQIEYMGKNAFKGINVSAVIYVPRSCLKDYRAMVRETGNTKVLVKAYN